MASSRARPLKQCGKLHDIDSTRRATAIRHSDDARANQSSAENLERLVRAAKDFKLPGDVIHATLYSCDRSSEARRYLLYCIPGRIVMGVDLASSLGSDFGTSRAKSGARALLSARPDKADPSRESSAHVSHIECTGRALYGPAFSASL